jgi:integrase
MLKATRLPFRILTRNSRRRFKSLTRTICKAVRSRRPLSEGPTATSLPITGTASLSLLPASISPPRLGPWYLHTRLQRLWRPHARQTLGDSKAAKLDDVRLHDLRHSFASVAASGGQSLIIIIGKMLGHSQPATTARYAHLADDPVKAASDAVGRHIAAAMESGNGAEVVPFAKSNDS